MNSESKQPVRILQVVTNMDRGGLETMLMNYYRHMDRSLVQFDFLVHRREEAAYDSEILSLGGLIYRLPRLVPWSFAYRKALRAFFDVHKEYGIIHVHQDCLSSVILKEAKKHNISVRIAHSHSSNEEKNVKYLVKLFYKRRIPTYANCFLACGELAGRWMFKGKTFSVMNNAIDSQKFIYDATKAQATREKLGITESPFVLGHVGRFVTIKNHSFILDIFSEMLKLDPNCLLLLVGSGSSLPLVKAKAEKLNILDKIILTGESTEVPNLLQAMDAFILPSLFEGLGISAVEAQAAGLPCFISDKVPLECIVTKGLVRQLQLTDPACKWAEAILTQKGTARTNRYEEIKTAGYDIGENAKRLQAFYLKEAKQ